MTKADMEIVLQRAGERFLQVNQRIVSDNGSQFVARDFETSIRQCGVTQVRTSPHCPQSNGKIERSHQSPKSECMRLGAPLSLEDARKLVKRFGMYYNWVRLPSAIGYAVPRERQI